MMSVVQNGRVMKNRWVNRDTAEFSARGIVFFHSQFEFPEPLPCKMYKIDQTHGSLWDHTHDYFQIWYVVRGCFTHSYLGRQYEMQAGSICIVPPYAVHRVEWMLQEKTEIIGCEFLPVYINDSFNQPMLQEDCLDYRYLQPLLAEEGKRLMKVSLMGEDDLRVRHILEEMRKEFRMKTPPRWYPTRRRNGSTVAAIRCWPQSISSRSIIAKRFVSIKYAVTPHCPKPIFVTYLKPIPGRPLTSI
ncbi:AraC family ligand binding domain-containing protein [Paenibacillus apiarius]|uniref:AraC family ligand binding domain-containing protein n=1 Tax=Paenibacillus apiarius TaxID=46240 RepID=UPI00197CB90C|nr:AraC family ligand binding domain-containing protein [Paenibacillus apiarius]MBN3523352.1 AraC family ligand binding domain-containing protein [Paenibacillus apiarius]